METESAFVGTGDETGQDAKQDSASFFKQGASTADFLEVIQSAQDPIEVLIDQLPAEIPPGEILSLVNPILKTLATLEPIQTESYLALLHKKLGGSRQIRLSVLRNEGNKLRNFQTSDEKSGSPENPAVDMGLPVYEMANRKFYLVDNEIFGCQINGLKTSGLYPYANFHIKLTHEVKVDENQFLEGGSGSILKGIVVGKDFEAPFEIPAKDWNDDKALKQAVALGANEKAHFLTKDINPIRWIAAALSEKKVVQIVSTYVGMHPSGDFQTPHATVRLGDVHKSQELGISVELDKGYLQARKIDLRNIDPVELPLAVRHIWMELVQVTSPSIMRSLLAHSFLAPLYWSTPRIRSQARPYLLILVGPSGSGKSECGRLVQSFTGNFSTEEDLASWGGASPKFTFDQAARVRGLSWFINDFKRSKLPGSQWNQSLQILHDLVDGHGRGKARPGTGAIAGPPINCLVAIPMEELPSFESALLGRALIVEHSGEKNEALRDVCLGWQESYPGVMARYIAYLQGQDRNRFADRLRGLFQEAKISLGDGAEEIDNAQRLCKAVALNQLGLEAFIEFSVQTEGLEDAEGAHHQTEHWKFLEGRLVHTAQMAQLTRPHDLFVRHLNELLSTDQISLRQKGKQAPTPDPRKKMVGYVSQDWEWVQLIPGVAMSVVRDAYFRSTGSDFPYGEDAVGTQLKIAGLLKHESKGTRLKTRHSHASGFTGDFKAWVLPAKIFPGYSKRTGQEC